MQQSGAASRLPSPHMTESMAQTIYDVGGTKLYLDPNTGDPSEFFSIKQGGDALAITGSYLEGFSRSLRRGTSAFLHVAGRASIGEAGIDGQPIILDFTPVLNNAEGWSGGILSGSGLILGGCGGRVNNVALVAAGWALVGNQSSPIHLVDNAGAVITTGLIAGDRLGFNLSLVTVSD